jgi:purine-binding chemotaxis protein CheW
MTENQGTLFKRVDMPDLDRTPVSLTNIVLAVRLGQQLFGIPIESVVEVLPALPIESLPDVPVFVRGAAFVRDQFLPVLDAARRFGLESRDRPLEPPIVCLTVGGRLIGIEFDEAVDLIELKPASLVSNIDLPGSAGVVSRLVEHEGRILRLLDPENLLDGAEAGINDQQNAV